jgi:hypothetical protein
VGRGEKRKETGHARGGKRWAARGRSGRGKDWAAGLACFPISFPFLFFKPTQIYLNSNQILIQTPMHSLK